MKKKATINMIKYFNHNVYISTTVFINKNILLFVMKTTF